MNRPDLSICIVNWNAGDYLLSCLRSIFKQTTDLCYEVIVIDNASTDDSISRVHRTFGRTRVIRLEKNMGFSGANNVGISACRGKYILLLNPDTIVRDNALKQMVMFMQNEPSAGIVGCKLVHPQSGVVESSARSFPTPSRLFWNLTYVDRMFRGSAYFGAYQMRYLQDAVAAREVDWVTGACLLARKEAIAGVGLLDEKFFMYCEDIDWCFRFRKSGWKVYFLPTAVVGHYRGQSSKLTSKSVSDGISLWGAQEYTRSIQYFYRKHYGRVELTALRLMIAISSVYKAVLWLAIGSLRYGWRSGAMRSRYYLSMIPILCRE